MKLDLSLSDPRTRRLLIVTGVILLVIIGVVIMIVRSRSKFAFPTSSSTGAEGTLYTDIQACTTAYRQALGAGLTDSTPPKSTCIKNAVDTFVTAKCPFVNDSTFFTGASASANQSAYGSAYTAYQAYVNSTASAAGSQYGVSTATNYINTVLNGTSLPSVTADIVKKARKADLTGPTRKYLANACSGIYMPASGNDTVSSIYQGWTADMASPNPPSSISTYGFWNALVTPARILEWSIKAADPITLVSASPLSISAAGSVVLTVANIGSIPSSGTIIVQGVGGLCTITSTTLTTITVNVPSQTVTFTPGSQIYMNTQTTINSVTPVTSAGNGTALSSFPTTAVTTGGPFTGLVLGLLSTVHSSIKPGSQVLLSGLNIPGNITVGSIGAGNTSVTLTFDSSVSTIPSFSSTQTIENAIAIPYANPIQSTNVPLHVTAKLASATSQSITVTVNGSGAGITAVTNTGTIVTLPTLTFTGVQQPNTIRVTASAAGPPQTYTLTNYTTPTGTTTGSVVWPDIPVGTVILASASASIATTAANATYNMIGKLNGTIMPLWQIAQSTGPGTVWPPVSSIAQPQYSL